MHTVEILELHKDLLPRNPAALFATLKCKCGNKSKSVQIYFVLELSRSRWHGEVGVVSVPAGLGVHVVGTS